MSVPGARVQNAQPVPGQACLPRLVFSSHLKGTRLSSHLGFLPTSDPERSGNCQVNFPADTFTRARQPHAATNPLWLHCAHPKPRGGKEAGAVACWPRGWPAAEARLSFILCRGFLTTDAKSGDRRRSVRVCVLTRVCAQEKETQKYLRRNSFAWKCIVSIAIWGI